MAKAASYIPAGFSSVSVHLHIKGAAEYLDFLKRAFGGVERARSEGPGGKLMHAEIEIAGTPVMIADDFGAEFGMPPMAVGRMPFNLQVYVPDADALYDQAVTAGCTATMPLADMFWGDRYGQLADPFGVTWAIATRREDLTREEILERMAKAFPTHA